MNKLISLTILICSVSGCTSYLMRVNTHIKGESITDTDWAYRNEVYDILLKPAGDPNAPTGMKDGVCSVKILPVTRRILYKSKDFLLEKDYKSPQHGLVTGKVIEQWTVEACGMKTPWYFLFEVDSGKRLPAKVLTKKSDLTKFR